MADLRAARRLPAGFQEIQEIRHRLEFVPMSITDLSNRHGVDVMWISGNPRLSRKETKETKATRETWYSSWVLPLNLQTCVRSRIFLVGSPRIIKRIRGFCDNIHKYARVPARGPRGDPLFLGHTWKEGLTQHTFAYI